MTVTALGKFVEPTNFEARCSELAHKLDLSWPILDQNMASRINDADFSTKMAKIDWPILEGLYRFNFLRNEDHPHNSSEFMISQMNQAINETWPLPPRDEQQYSGSLKVRQRFAEIVAYTFQLTVAYSDYSVSELKAEFLRTDELRDLLSGILDDLTFLGVPTAAADTVARIAAKRFIIAQLAERGLAYLGPAGDIIAAISLAGLIVLKVHLNAVCHDIYEELKIRVKKGEITAQDLLDLIQQSHFSP